MKPFLRTSAIVIGLGVVAALASGRLAGWFAGAAEARLADAVPAPASTATTGGCFDETEMRRVIREELAAARAATTPAQGSQAPEPVHSPPASVASAGQLERVNRQVDLYIQAGVISDSEMARLQSEIARLDPAARRAAMQRLVRALNSGALEGHL